MKKMIMSAALVAAMIFTGCGGVDKQKLAQLTGNKSFEQVKESYRKAEKEAYEARERARPDYVEKVQIPRKTQNQE